MRWSLPLLAFLIAIPLLAAEPKYTIITTGDALGFREGKEIYTLGMSADDFQRRFGKPEKSQTVKDATLLNYLGDGVGAVVIDGKIESITFFLRDVDEEPYPKMKGTTANTDKGIGRGSTYRDLTKAHGEPTRKKDIETSGTHPAQLVATYKLERGTVQFAFTDGTLSEISITLPRK